jgi:hypothetical protein
MFMCSRYILYFGPVSLALWKDTVCAFYMFDRCGLISIFCLRLALWKVGSAANVNGLSPWVLPLVKSINQSYVKKQQASFDWHHIIYSLRHDWLAQLLCIYSKVFLATPLLYFLPYTLFSIYHHTFHLLCFLKRMIHPCWSYHVNKFCWENLTEVLMNLFEVFC